MELREVLASIRVACWREVDPPVEPGEDHRIAGDDLPASVASDEQQCELACRSIPEVAEILDRLVIEPLGLVDHDNPWALCEYVQEPFLDLCPRALLGNPTGLLQELLNERLGRRPTREVKPRAFDALVF